MDVTIKFDADDDQDVRDTLIKLSAEMIKLARTCGDTSIDADIERRKVMLEISRLGNQVIEIAHLRQRIKELRGDLNRLYGTKEDDTDE